MNTLEEVLKEIGGKPNLDKENVIYEVKYALQAKDLGTYNEWKEDGFNVNHLFYRKDALLHLAAEYDSIEMVEALIKNGANVNVVGHSEETPLHHAARFGGVEVMKILIENGANVNAVNEIEQSPLCIAVQQAPWYLRTTIVKVLIENGADVNVVNGYDKQTPLHETATSSNSIDTVRILIENGANVNAVDRSKNTPLHLAAKWGCTEIVKSLMENGADPNVINEHDEDTPLHLAAKNNHLEVVKHLIDKGAGINAKNINRKTPLDWAKDKEKGYGKIVEYLTAKIAEMPHKKDEALQVYQNEYFDDDAFLANYYSLREKKIDERKEEKPLKKKDGCSIQSYQRQGQNVFISHSLPNIEIKPARQGLYLPSFEECGIRIDGKCVPITRGLSQALFLHGEKSFLSNLETSAEIYERIAQGNQVFTREEREVFAFSKLLNNFEKQLDSTTNSLPSSLIHTKDYKTLCDLSNYITEVKVDFAIHLVTSNHVVAIYRNVDNYSYFDSNAVFVSGLKSVDQLMQVVEKAVESAGYKVREKGFLVEHFDVEQANKLLSTDDRQVLAKEIKTDRQLLAEQDEELGLIKINGQELSRVQLYDFGTKIDVEGSVPLLINADMNLSSEKFQDLMDKEEVGMTAREYLGNLKDSKNVEEVVQATKFIPVIGSKREIEEAKQTRASQNNRY